METEPNDDVKFDNIKIQPNWDPNIYRRLAMHDRTIDFGRTVTIEPPRLNGEMHQPMYIRIVLTEIQLRSNPPS